MASKREIRTIRIEDHEGNVYKPEGVGNGGGGGESVGSGDIGSPDSGSVNTSDGTQVGDPDSNGGTAIIVPPSTTLDKNVATIIFGNVTFGKWAVVIRAKSSLGGGSNDNSILRVKTYYIDNTNTNPMKLLSTTLIKVRHFEAANKYCEVGFVTDFTGLYSSSVSLKVVVELIANCGATVTFDQMTVAKSFVAVTGTPTSIS